MFCRLYERQLSSYVDGELPAARAARVEAHLRVCPHCRGELNAMIGIAEHIRAASKQFQVSQDFDQRVLRAVGYIQITGRQVAHRSYLRPLVMLMLALLALLGLIWHYLSPPPVAQPQPAAAEIAPAPPSSPIPVAPPARERRGR